MAVKKLSNIGGIGSIKTTYPNMLTNYGDFGAMQRIQYATATGSSSIVEFLVIPQTFTDLRVVVFARTSRAATTDGLNIKFNTDDANNYSNTEMLGNGSTASSARNTNTSRWFIYSDNLPAANATSGIFGSTTIDILNYTNTSTNKTGIARWATDLNGSGTTGTSVGLWRNTNAISAITLISRNNANFVSGSTFALYGIKASAS